MASNASIAQKCCTADVSQLHPPWIQVATIEIAVSEADGFQTDSADHLFGQVGSSR